MATSASRVRAALLRVARAARAELRAVAAAASREPALWRSALFASAPLIVSEYTSGSATLALDWYEELRAEVSPSQLYTPTPRIAVTDADVAAMVARITESLREVKTNVQAEVDKMKADSLSLLEDAVQREVADGFRDTITENAKADPGSVGWRRFARPEACKFCLMLAERGAVYTEATARFAAHGHPKGGECMCIAGPEFGGKEIWAEATPMQYVASSKRSSNPDIQAARNQRVRDYLNHNFPDAHG